MSGPVDRLVRAVSAVLPAEVALDVRKSQGRIVSLVVGRSSVNAAWIGEGWLGDLDDLVLTQPASLDLVVARRMSPGAQARAAELGLGWVDETGAAELSLRGIVLSRTGRAVRPHRASSGWSGSVIGTAEALLVGVRPTVAAIHERTGLSTGAATAALAALTNLGLLDTTAARGRNSARRVRDQRELLGAYAAAAGDHGRDCSISVGVVGDVLGELRSLGREWTAAGIGYSLTGTAGGALVAPYLAEVSQADVLVDASTPAELDALARRSGLQVLDGGRVTLRPYPTAVSDRLSTVMADMRVAPWPRIYVDLRAAGVRGEEAAEHLWEAMRD